MKVIALILSSLLSCRQATDFTDRYTTDAIDTRIQRMQTAPIIFVGVVDAVQMIGSPKPATRLRGLTLQLYRARCRVEVCLRGKVPDQLEFWYFGPDPRHGMAGFPKFWLQPAQRRIFFVEQTGLTYRAVGDYLDYTEWVQSGKPNEIIVDTDREVGKAIARVMLTPGQGFDEGVFSGELLWASHVAISFSSKAYAIELLKVLTTHTSTIVRATSCRILATNYSQIPPTCPGKP